MIAEKVEISRADEKSVSATSQIILSNGRTEKLRYDFTGITIDEISHRSDPLCGTLLTPAMSRGEDLQINGVVSSRLAFNLLRIRDVCNFWWPQFKKINISIPDQDYSSGLTAKSAISFFSGGVDSFYTLLKYQHIDYGLNLERIIYLRGVETNLSKIGNTDGSEAAVRAVAAEYGINVISGETNLRNVGRLHWEKYYHGHALAGLASFFSDVASVAMIPSAFSYNHLVPHGSSPITDEMYTSQNQIVAHDGAEVTRAQKIERCLELNPMLFKKYLRVCIANKGENYNCGKCRKCVRTAVPLLALGAFNHANFICKTTDHWKASVMTDHLALVKENRDLAERVDAPLWLRDMLADVIKEREGMVEDKS